MHKAFLLIIFFHIFSCASITKNQRALQEDYKLSLKSFSNAEYKKALKVFPEKENGGFITTLEK